MISTFTILLIFVLLISIVIIISLCLNSSLDNLQSQINELTKKIQRYELTENNTKSVESDLVHSNLKATIEQDVKIAEKKPEYVEQSENTNDLQQLTNIQPVTSTQTSQHQPWESSPSRNQSTKQGKNPSVFNSFFTWLFQGNLIAKVGIIILFFGLSYLFKHSIENQLILPNVRIFGALILGLVLFVFGWYLRTKKRIYALILQGGSVGILYLTIFAACKLYALIPFLVAIILLITLCSVSVLFAVLQRAMSLAIIASIGGYLAPILLSTNSDNHITLFSYYSVISSAILVISIWQSWRILNLIGFVFTFVITASWGIINFRPEFYTECQFFIIVNMITYGILATSLAGHKTNKKNHPHIIDIILFFGTPITAFMLQYAITRQWPLGPTFSSLGFGIFYLTIFYITLHYNRFTSRTSSLFGIAIGLSFITLAIALWFNLEWTVLIWLFEGTALSWVMLNNRQFKFAMLGAFINTFSLLYLCYNLPNLVFTVTENIFFLGLISLILLINALIWHYYCNQNNWGNIFKIVFFVLASHAWVIWILYSIIRIDQIAHKLPILLLAFLIATWVLYYIGQKLKWTMLKFAVLLLWPIMLFLRLINEKFLFDTNLLTTNWNMVWAIAFLSCYFYLYIIKDRLIKAQNYFYLILHISLFLMTLDWLFFEIKNSLSLLPLSLETIQYCTLFFLDSGIVLLFYLLVKKRLLTHFAISKTYWLIGLAPIIIYLFVKLFIFIFYSGQIINWPYIPIFNPLELSAIFALLMIRIWIKFSAYFIQFDDQKISLSNINQKLPNFATILLIVMACLWTNSMILRCLSQWLDIPWSFYQLWNSKIIQATISLIWTLVAVVLVTIGHRYQQRITWFTGVTLQTIVVIKLILIDSIELEGLLKAFAFIAIAILMLIIGYLAPLPPKIKVENNEANK